MFALLGLLGFLFLCYWALVLLIMAWQWVFPRPQGKEWWDLEQLPPMPMMEEIRLRQREEAMRRRGLPVSKELLTDRRTIIDP